MLEFTLSQELFPSGSILTSMKYTPKHIGAAVKTARKRLGVTQRDLAMTSGTGLRFISDLEQGKPTCQLGKVLSLLHTLGITLELHGVDEGRSHS